MKNLIIILIVLFAFSTANATNSYILGSADISSVTADTTAPSLTSATQTAATTLSLVFDENVVYGAGGSAGWTITWSTAGATTYTYASGSGSSTVVFTGNNSVTSGETTTNGLDYTQPTNGWEDDAGNDLATINDFSVTNSVPAAIETHYVTQDGGGGDGGDGSSGDPWSVAEFNNSANWDTDVSADDLIGPGDEVSFAGATTSQIIPAGSGTSGNVITFSFDGTFESTVRNSGGAFRIYSKDYLVVDGFDGTPTGTTGSSTGIYMYDASNITVINSDLDDYKSTTNAKGVGVWVSSSDYITIGTEGNGNNFKDCGSDDGSSSVMIDESDDTIVAYNVMAGNTDGSAGIDGITVLTSNRCLIEYNHILDMVDDTGEIGEDGIDLKGLTDGIIRYNLIDNIVKKGININYRDADTPDTENNNIYIYGNRITDVSSGILITETTDGAAAKHSGINIWSNEIFLLTGVTGYGIRSEGDALTTYIYNNSLYSAEGATNTRPNIDTGGDIFITKNNAVYNTHHREVFESPYANCTVDDNQWYWSGGTAVFDWNGNSTTTIGTVDSNGAVGDPDFTDPANGDLTLAVGSPCINSGTDLSGNPGTITIQGVNYTPTFDTALDPTTDWSLTLNSTNIKTKDQDSEGTGWERGAYVYDE